MIATAPNEVHHDYAPGPSAWEMFNCTDPEVLYEGPAGTGKSRAVGERLYADAMEYPGSRQAIVRKTRVSLTQSFLVTWETKVLYPEHPVIQGPGRANRQSYVFENGSEIAVAGMDNPTRLFSTEFDRIYVNEAQELSLDEWESLHRALRNGVMPFQQLIGDCNPDAAFHWLNKRFPPAGKADITGKQRILSRHTDNPSLSKKYLDGLSNMTGVRRARLFLGQWVSAEGQIWENFDPDRHVIHGELTRRASDGRWMLYVSKWLRTVELTWFFAAVDWGFRNPGAMLIFGVDKDRNAYCVEEIYRLGKNKVWWAERAEEMRKKYDIQRFVCDDAEPDSIDLFNERMGRVGGMWLARPVGKKANDFEPSAGLVRERFNSAGLFLLSDMNKEPDQTLMADSKPMGLIEEIPSFVYREIRDGQPVREEPAQDSDDHASDALRYAMMFLDRNDWQPAEPEKKFPPMSYGDLLGHNDADIKYELN